MKPKTLTLMVLAVACGLAASYMTSRLLAERQANTEEDVKVTVLVAKQNIPMGTRLGEPEKFFVEKHYTKGEEPKKALKSFDQLKDRRLNKPLSAEQFVSTDDLYTKEQEGLSALLPPGMRAVSIRVNPESVVAGFVQPNSRVDVLVTVRRGDNDSFSQVLLQNMLVVAVDQTPTRDPERPAMLASTVTLAAKPDDAQKLALAGQLGELRLTLRAWNDEEIAKTRSVTPREISRNSSAQSAENSGESDGGGSKVPIWNKDKIPDVTPAAPKVEEKKPEPVVVAEKKDPKTHTLVIYNGDQPTKAVFTLDEQGKEVTQTQIQKEHPEQTQKHEPKKPEEKKPESTEASKPAHPTAATPKTEQPKAQPAPASAPTKTEEK